MNVGGHDRERLLRIAGRLGAGRRKGKLPALVMFTDPARTPDPVAAVRDLPRGSVVVYRAFGAADAADVGRRLRRLTWRRGLTLLVGADPALAARLRADGLHLPERLAHAALRWRRRRPGWIVTAAAHSGAAARRAARAGVDAVFVSPVFPSRSASTGRPIGVVRLAQHVRSAGAPVYALGGVNARSAARLPLTGVSGLAAVDGLNAATVQSPPVVPRTGTRSPA